MFPRRAISNRRAHPVASLLALAPWFFGCDSGGGGGLQKITLRYAGDLPAYGLFIEAGVGADAGGDSSPNAMACSISAAAEDAGCTANISTDADGVRLALHNCFMDAGEAVFDCELNAELVKSLTTDPTVHAGCGCEVVCPTSPAISVCHSGTTECSASETASAEAGARPDRVVTTQPGAGGTTCSTCCETDYYPWETGSVRTEEVLTEIAFDVYFAKECAIDVNGSAKCEVEPSFDWANVDYSDRTLVKRFCFAGRDLAHRELLVSLVLCKGSIVDTVVRRALGPDFAPLAELPDVKFD